MSTLLTSSWLDSPLGPVLAIADETVLFLLEFAERRGLKREIERLQLQQKAEILPGMTAPIASIEQELKAYFEGSLRIFNTPIAPITLFGTPFQQKTWQGLMQIPYGETRSYAALAAAIGQPSACRAVANANGANPLTIVIPCHRVIQSDGAIGGYGGGVARKQWLIAHERSWVAITQTLAPEYKYPLPLRPETMI